MTILKNKKNNYRACLVKLQQRGGYSMLEVLFYISLFAALSMILFNVMIVMTKSFKETRIYGELMQGATITEKISREIRQAESINSLSLTDLTLNTKNEIGESKTVQFLLSGSDLQFKDDDVLVGNLNTPNINIEDLSFTEITTTEGKAVKVILTIFSNNDSNGRIENFYNTAVLRRNY